MFLITVYDVGEKRVNKVLKTCRKYLNWVQNSVLEGEISYATFEKLKLELKKVIDESNDSVIFYVLRTTKYSERQTIGIKKGGDDMFI
jgi:CRISPR-associated protein Cas2